LAEELAEAVRRSLMARLFAILSGKDWRAGRPYQPHLKRTTGRRWERRAKASEPKPVEIDAGDWIKVIQKIPSRPGVNGRVGYVHVVDWSGNKQKTGSARGVAEACWLARVEFKRVRGSSRNEKRMNCSLPLTALAKVAVPVSSSN
jgi:hypothetical protein